VRWTADSASPRWTADRGRGGALLARGAQALELAGDGGKDEPVEVVLGRCSPATERWRTGGNERQRLELVARAKEGAKVLGREGMRCGESQGSHCPFIGVGGSPERGGRGE
jgi:hypothetical protein